jgi:hypothetical protein
VKHALSRPGTAMFAIIKKLAPGVSASGLAFREESSMEFH